MDEDAPALLDIVGHLREVDVAVSRAPLLQHFDPDTVPPRTSPIASTLVSAFRLRCSALDAADIVNRLSAAAGEVV